MHKRWMGLGVLLVTIVAVTAIGTQAQQYVAAFRVVAKSAREQADPATVQDPLIVHEWGTFTSFSGSDGVQLEFRPLLDDQLPDFVLTRATQAGIKSNPWSKGNIRARYRMETPVTYFYTKQERKVHVAVAFPEGLLTEFYPPVVAMSPVFSTQAAEKVGKSKLDWGEVFLIPISSLKPQLEDGQRAEMLQQRIEASLLPVAYSPHYFHARETDSALVHVRISAKAGAPAAVQGDFLEKFLFYRGVGKFTLPVDVQVTEAGPVSLSNQGELPFRALFLITVANKSIQFTTATEVAAHKTVTLPLPHQPVELESLRQRMQHALVAEGLYEKEAKAMVATWEDSWFQEEGTRLFYLVPQAITERLLPLTITPVPDTIVRVLVGRMEILSPAVEKDLSQVVAANAVKRQAQVKKSNAQAPLPIPEKLSKLGRLAEPALARIHQLAKDPVVAGEAQHLMQQIRQEQLARDQAGAQ